MFDIVDFTLVAGSAQQVVSLDDAKLHLRVDGNVEDDYIEALVGSCVDYAQKYTGLELLQSTWTCNAREWNTFRMFKTPVQSVQSIKYFDKDNNEQTLASTEYYVTIENGCTKIEFKESVYGIELYEKPNAIVISLTAGFAGVSVIPKSIIAGIKLMLGHLYENRQAVVTGTIATELPLGVKNLFDINSIKPVL